MEGIAGSSILFFSLLQKGSWALAPAENPPKLSALEMLENSLYSPTWEGRRLRGPGRDGGVGWGRKGVLGKGVIKWSGGHGEVGSS